jgi:hypothetical protein
MENCPFCGSDNLEAVCGVGPAPWFVSCESCLATGPAAKGPDAAERAWDERKAD